MFLCLLCVKLLQKGEYSVAELNHLKKSITLGKQVKRKSLTGEENVPNNDTDTKVRQYFRE